MLWLGPCTDARCPLVKQNAQAVPTKPSAPLAPAPPPLNNRAPIKKAAALQYEQGSKSAPKLTAKGRGAVAEKILEAAREHNIPVTQDADLMEILEKVEIDTEIPLEVYAVVADIFAWVYKLNQKKALGT